MTKLEHLRQLRPRQFQFSAQITSQTTSRQLGTDRSDSASTISSLTIRTRPCETCLVAEQGEASFVGEPITCTARLLKCTYRGFIRALSYGIPMMAKPLFPLFPSSDDSQRPANESQNAVGGKSSAKFPTRHPAQSPSGVLY